ncbi:MAG: pyridoxine 5'-phosphate synthase [Alphaproteobacteria bacterium]|nr:pyridoxine 5'-phosphate synthase [Alphaproteobacteria bacterium]MBV9863460.1 pyridoxine 5'-phosphate synthase [Alphaproteobacteria bacterium]
MTRLSVNLNKIALLRNSRVTGVPDVAKFAHIALDAGADGLTVHPRPDERHIRRSDVPILAELMRPRRPAIELNIEGYPDPRWLALVEEIRPEQCTLVPDPPDAFTSEAGWRLDDDAEAATLAPLIARLKALPARVILFVDPDCPKIERARALGADGVEIYTGTYAAAYRAGDHARALADCVATATRAAAAGLVVNIGHDLNLDNLPALVAAMPPLAEASIGHELTADALAIGFAAAVAAYKAALNPLAAAV